eukprot:365296-Chlamydomonas_euryale.AAC.16
MHKWGDHDPFSSTPPHAAGPCRAPPRSPPHLFSTAAPPSRSVGHPEGPSTLSKLRHSWLPIDRPSEDGLQSIYTGKDGCPTWHDLGPQVRSLAHSQTVHPRAPH